jgi:hypothetical protein
MGSGRWDPDQWSNHVTSNNYSSKSTQQIFSKSGLDKEMDPKGLKYRESCDSTDNPLSTPVILALDVTGSMGHVADAIVRTSLNTVLTEVYNRKPITDPHVLVAGIGDAIYDSAPLQVSQFEADLRVAKQLEKIWLEGNGGGNGWESYALAWYFAAHHTKIDSFIKRQRKGYLFTMGDEAPTEKLTAEHILKVFGYKPEKDINLDELLTLVTRQWDVFHLEIEQSPSYPGAPFHKQWVGLLGEQAVRVADHTKLAEVIVSIMQIREGALAKNVIDSWDGSTGMVVANATRGLTKREADSAVVTL